MEFKIKAADIIIDIRGQYPYLEEYCRNYITEEPDADLKIEITRKEIQAEANETCQNLPYLETLAALRKIAEAMPHRNRFLMHGTVVAWKEQGFLFTAPSGTGKSTHASLWKKYLGEDVRIINGDKPILKVAENGILAYGTPWAGKECWEENTCVKLKGICFLYRGQINQIQKVTAGEALPLLMRQIYHPMDAETAGKTLELLDRVMREVPLYVLQCDVSEEAVLCSLEGMAGEKRSVLRKRAGMVEGEKDETRYR